jgi:hypothetical protein
MVFISYCYSIQQEPAATRPTSSNIETGRYAKSTQQGMKKKTQMSSFMIVAKTLIRVDSGLEGRPIRAAYR